MAIGQVKIDKDHTLKMDASIGWLIKYREQFGHDILPDLLPLISIGVNAAIDTMDKLKGDTVDIKTLVAALDKDVIEGLMMNVAMLESTTILNIVWALNANFLRKNDEEIKTPSAWAEDFSNFPLDLIIPKALKLIIESTVSTKNLKRLQSLKKTMTQSTQTKSSLEQSQEE